MPTVEVKKIHVVPTALTLAVVAAALGLIYGIFFALGAGSMGAFAGMMGMEGAMGMAGLGALMIVIFPIISFIYTFIVIAIGAIIYNLVAERIGGIKFES